LAGFVLRDHAAGVCIDDNVRAGCGGRREGGRQRQCDGHRPEHRNECLHAAHSVVQYGDISARGRMVAFPMRGPGPS
jgi:hypothetical protein